MSIYIGHRRRKTSNARYRLVSRRTYFYELTVRTSGVNGENRRRGISLLYLYN